jgi:hypothetical protein
MENLAITVTIQNNTSSSQQVNLLGSPFNPLDTSNAKTQYVWNITALVFTTETQLTLQYRNEEDPYWSNYLAGLPMQNADGVVAALNALGIGYFCKVISGINTYIETYNDDYVFGDMNIFPTSAQLQYSFGTSAGGGGGDNKIDKNFVNVVNQANPVTTSGTVAVTVGDTITFYGTTDVSGLTTVQVYNITRQVVMYQPPLGASTAWSYTFTVGGNTIYALNVLDNF